MSSGVSKPRIRKGTIIVPYKFGRLANRLTMFANMIALAQEYGYRIRYPSMHYFARDFENLRSDPFCRYPPLARASLISRVPPLDALLRRLRLLHHASDATRRILQSLSIPGVAVVQPIRRNRQPVPPGKLIEIAEHDNTSIVFMRDWYIRAPDLVIKHAGSIRHFLRPTAEIEERAAEPARQLREKADIIIGVHIRHGDYKRYRKGIFYFPLSRYVAWMRGLADDLAPARVAFLVCSDTAFELEAFSGLTVAAGPGDAIGDLFALATCDRLIGPVSTFSQWAAFYGDIPLYLLNSADDRPVPEKFAVSDLSVCP